jgi:hypothetical protein
VSFFKVFTSLLKNYRSFILVPPEIQKASLGDGRLELDAAVVNDDFEFNAENCFRTSDFLNTQDRETRPFVSILVKTQAFSQFLFARIMRPESDYEVLFFDESIKDKLNRSRLKFSKDITPFLKDTTYGIRAIFPAAAPSLEGLDPGQYKICDFFYFILTIILDKSYSTSFFPIALDTSLIIPSRAPAPLLTESDQRMMRSHTNELVNKARTATGVVRNQFSYYESFLLSM